MTWVHDLSPFALQFTEQFGIRWYGLAYLAGFLAGYWFIRYLARQGLTPIPEEKAGDFVFAVAVGVVVGGRLGYCLFYSPKLLIDFSAAFPYWGVLALQHGGMASHGGIAGLFIACLYFARRERLPLFALTDLTTIGGSLGVFFGRLANFVNGELFGRPVQSSVSWAVKFPQEMFTWPSAAPHKLAELGPVVAQVGISPERWQALTGSLQLAPQNLRVIEGIMGRIIEVIQSGNVVVKSQLAPLLADRHPSQLYGALLEGLVIFLVIAFIWRKARRPGLISVLYGFLYPSMRILSESFRMPDANIGFQLFGLTRGQWLSIGMYGFALLALFTVVKSWRGLPPPSTPICKESE